MAYTQVLKVVKKPLSGACTGFQTFIQLLHRNIGHSRLIGRLFFYIGSDISDRRIGFFLVSAHPYILLPLPTVYWHRQFIIKYVLLWLGLNRIVTFLAVVLSQVTYSFVCPCRDFAIFDVYLCRDLSLVIVTSTFFCVCHYRGGLDGL